MAEVVWVTRLLSPCMALIIKSLPWTLFVCIAEVYWIDLNHFAHEAGLDLVACLNILQRSDGVWDLRDSLHLVSFYNEMGRNVSWELGYGMENNIMKFILTSWSWALLEKLPVVQLLKNSTTFCGSRRFITMFTRALHWSLSVTDQSSPHYPILSLHFNIIHPPSSWSSNGLFPTGFHTNILYAFHFYPFVLHALPTSSSLTWSF